MNNHAGWFPVEEAALRKLKATYDRPAAFRKAQLAYMVLLRIANLEGKDVFSRRVASIADDMGFNYDEATQALRLVEQAGLLEITKTGCSRVKGTGAIALSGPAYVPGNSRDVPGKSRHVIGKRGKVVGKPKKPANPREYPRTPPITDQ
ncbi:MAG: hypothetical protein WDO13_06170 [Verrucomicrobiota bacterium]